MASDPNEILFQLNIDASRFGTGIEQVSRQLDKLGIILQGGTAKWETFVNASGQTIAKFQAITDSGAKFIATFDRVGNHFEVTSAKISDSIASVAQSFEDSAARQREALSQIQSQQAARVTFEAQAAAKLKTIFDKEANDEVSSQQKAKLDIQNQINARIAFEKNAEERLKGIFAQEEKDRKASLTNVARAEFEAYAQSVAAKQRAAQSQNQNGFLNSFRGSLPGGSSAGTGAFLGAFAGSLTASGINALVSSLRTGISDAIEFERALARLAASQQATSLTTDQLTKSVLDLSDKFNIDKNDVVTAKLNSFRSSLVKTDQDSQTLLDTSAKLSKLTGSTLVDSTETITTTLNAFGLKAEDADKVAENLFATFRNGGPSIRDTETVLGQLGSQLSPFGIHFNEITATLEAFNKRGVTANETLTILSNIFSRLSNPGTNKGILEFFDKEGVVNLDQLIGKRGLSGTIEDLAQEAKRGSSEIAELFGQSRSGKGGVAIVGILGDIKKALAESAESSGNLNKAFEDLQVNSGEKLSNNLNTLKNSFTEFGQAFAEFISQTPIFKSLAESIKVAADHYKELAHNTSAAVDEDDALIEKLLKIANINKQLREVGHIIPGTDLKGVPSVTNDFRADLFQGATPFLARKFQARGGNLQDLVVDEDAAKAIQNEQKRQEVGEQLRGKQDTREKEFKNRVSQYFDETTKAAITSFTQRQEEHLKLVNKQAEGEKLITENIKKSFDIQFRRADEEVHKIEEVAKKSESIRKDSLERIQSAEDDFETRRFQRQQKLFGKNPFLLAQLNQQRDTQLKSDAFGLVNALPNLGDDDFLASKNIEIARKKLSERTGNQEATLDKTIEARLQGKASDQDVLNAQQKLVQYKQDEFDLEKKLRDISKEKEESKKAEADAQREVVDKLKNNVSTILEFNPFIDKNKRPGQRGISGSPEEQLSKFEELVSGAGNVKKNLSVSELVNFDSTINQKREQLKRELGLETTEGKTETESKRLLDISKGNLTPDKVVQIVEGFDKLGKSLQTGGKESGVIGKLEGFGAALDDVTRKINERNANNPSFAAQVHGVKVSQTDEGVSNVGTTIRNNITINVSSDDPNQAGKVLRDELRKQARRGIIITGEVGED